jgi:GNAT superfamily N-acetyltransferase
MAPTPRRLGLDDVSACADLAVNRGWFPEITRWKMLLSIGEGWGVDDPDGGLSATVVLTRFPLGLAAVGLMLVRESRSRQGLGRLLMEHVLPRAHPDTVFLYATALGEPLYEKLGFVAVDRVARHIGSWKDSPHDGAWRARPLAPGEFTAVLALDRLVFGADRRELLSALVSIADRTLVLERNGSIAAFGIAWPNVGRVHLGPIVAPDEDAARTLIADLARNQTLPLRFDLSVRWNGLSAWAVEHGITAQPSIPLMALNGKQLPGDRKQLIAVATLATG